MAGGPNSKFILTLNGTKMKKRKKQERKKRSETGGQRDSRRHKESEGKDRVDTGRQFLGKLTPYLAPLTSLVFTPEMSLPSN